MNSLSWDMIPYTEALVSFIQFYSTSGMSLNVAEFMCTLYFARTRRDSQRVEDLGLCSCVPFLGHVCVASVKRYWPPLLIVILFQIFVIVRVVE